MYLFSKYMDHISCFVILGGFIHTHAQRHTCNNCVKDYNYYKAYFIE